ncbi:type II secretion system protein GspG [Oceanihabitans sediminis]|uniref:type II secretion system protein GspG n=1 Tax=Oceanihabitans sediminis TaxID=1812012 RepID=UPI00299E2682|nr:type II secretion system protein GspG [Oceanihabitans sediminis]MDX1773016.1 type II secretion system protein GspG [Oceanihabitans sediminis]
MLEIILSFLAEFGLIREDFKHHKRISKRVKEDGIKRPIQKYFLQPSVLIFLTIFIVFMLSTVLFFTYQRTSVFPDKTKIEISEMSKRMESWNEKFGQYPQDINQLIGNSPIRQDWKKDAWNREYKFKITKNGKGFLIISAGSDGIFGTEDDIQSEK